MLAADPKVGVFEHVDLQRLNRGNKDPLPDVELAVVFLVSTEAHVAQKQRPLDVLLDHLGRGRLLRKRVDDFVLVFKAKDP